MTKHCKKIIVLAIAALLVGFMILSYFLWIKPKPVEGVKAFVTIEIEYANFKNSYKVKNTSTTTLLGLLDEQNTKLNLKVKHADSTYGKYLTSMLGTDGNNAASYMVKINGVDCLVGITDQTFVEGDLITFYYWNWTDNILVNGDISEKINS